MLSEPDIWRKRLNRFKVTELRTIAQECELVQSGKKADLICRIADNVQRDRLIEVIENMGGRRTAPPLPTPPAPRPTSPNLNNPNMRNRSTRRPDDLTTRNSKRRRLDRAREVDKADSCLCRGLPSQQMLLKLSEPPTLVQCHKCRKHFHSCCVHRPPKLRSIPFMCPRCRLEQIDPFYPAVSVLHLVTLFDDQHPGATHPAKRNLPLKSPNIHELRRRGAEVFLFCLRYTNWNTPLIHEWPMTVSVKVNNNLEKILKPEYEHKRRDLPMRLTPYLLADPQNVIEVQAHNFPESQKPHDPYFIGLCLCDKKSSEDIEAEVLANQRLSYDESKDRVMRMVNRFFGRETSGGGSGATGADDDDDEIDIIDTSCRVKLICPITLTRIRVPVRGRGCLHLQCYDLNSWLEVTKSTKAFANRWKCVECNAFIRPKELIIDSFIEHILSVTDPNAEAVEFQADGTWQEQMSNLLEALDDESDEDAEAPADEAEKEAEGPIDLVELSSDEEGTSKAPSSNKEDEGDVAVITVREKVWDPTSTVTGGSLPESAPFPPPPTPPPPLELPPPPPASLLHTGSPLTPPSTPPSAQSPLQAATAPPPPPVIPSMMVQQRPWQQQAVAPHQLRPPRHPRRRSSSGGSSATLELPAAGFDRRNNQPRAVTARTWRPKAVPLQRNNNMRPPPVPQLPVNHHIPPLPQVNLAGNLSSHMPSPAVAMPPPVALHLTTTSPGEGGTVNWGPPASQRAVSFEFNMQSIRPVHFSAGDPMGGGGYGRYPPPRGDGWAPWRQQQQNR